jgi:hypothetical protein
MRPRAVSEPARGHFHIVQHSLDAGLDSNTTVNGADGYTTVNGAAGLQNWVNCQY